MTNRAVLYARVSTDEQGEYGYSLTTQIQAMRQYCQEHGLKPIQEFQEDYTGTKLDRPELDKARRMFDKHQADALVVYTGDRFARKAAHSLILREEWQR